MKGVEKQNEANTPAASHHLTVTLAPGLTPGVVTVTGPDAPGVSADFFRILAEHDVQLLDVEQAVFRETSTSPPTSVSSPATPKPCDSRCANNSPSAA